MTTGARAVGWEDTSDGAVLHLDDGRNVSGRMVIAADGIHSALRACQYPSEGAPIWDGRILWRATTRAPLFKGDGAMVMIGTANIWKATCRRVTSSNAPAPMCPR